MREDPLLFETRPKAAIPLRTSSRTALMYGPELRIGQPVGQQVEAFQNRQPGADQRDELLVEDQELFDIELLPAAAGRRPRAGMRPFAA